MRLSFRDWKFNYKAVLIYLSIFLFLVLQFVLIRRIYIKHTSQDLNLILISVDTLRADHMGIYGYSRNTTPNIDDWAKTATVFTNAYTIMPLTAQSFYTLFTGRDDVFKNGSFSNSHPVTLDSEGKNALTLAKILKENNYSTTAIISNPVLGNVFKFFRSGFDQFDFIDISGGFAKVKNPNPGMELIDLYSQSFSSDYENSQIITTKATGWLKANYKDKKKFFLWLHYSTPHSPYNPQIKYVCKIENQFCDTLKYQDILLGECFDQEREVSTQTIDFAKLLYNAEILSVDEQIGKILQELRNLNIDRKTIVIFYGDHGEGFDHDIFYHGNALYNSSIHIPLIIRSPFYKKALIVPKLIDNTDISPTVLDLLGIPYYKNQFSGLSFISAFDTSKQKEAKHLEKKYIYSLSSADTTNKFTILDGAYKYIYSNVDECLYKGYREELYNLKTDPEEKNNLIGKEDSVASRLKKSLFEEIKRRSKTSDLESTNRNKDIINKLKSLGY